MDLLATGSENGTLSVFDIRSEKEINEVKSAHSESISSVLIDSNGINVFTGGEDGILKTWDIRNLKTSTDCIVSVQAHEKKADEAIHQIVRHPKLPLLVTSGADHSIIMFETFA